MADPVPDDVLLLEDALRDLLGALRACRLAPDGEWRDRIGAPATGLVPFLKAEALLRTRDAVRNANAKPGISALRPQGSRKGDPGHDER